MVRLTFISILIAATAITAAAKVRVTRESTVSTRCAGSDRAPTVAPSRALFNAIRHVESSGNDFAVGDYGRSRGPYQIQKPYWDEACRHSGVKWRYGAYVWSRSHSERVMAAYWDKVGAVTDEQKARVHNGGPNGFRSAVTKGYWRKVRFQINAARARVGGTRAARSR